MLPLQRISNNLSPVLSLGISRMRRPDLRLALTFLLAVATLPAVAQSLRRRTFPTRQEPPPRRRPRLSPPAPPSSSTPPWAASPARLFDKQAPNAVANFIGLAEGTKDWTDPPPAATSMHHKPFYDGPPSTASSPAS